MKKPQLSSQKTIRILSISIVIVIILASLFLVSDMVLVDNEVSSQDKDNKQEETMTYTSISMQEAFLQLNNAQDYVLLDVRRADEFAAGHIPNAINIANETIDKTIVNSLPNKNQLIFVYCRSGRRSKEASHKLVELGYTNIVEIGGILDWPGDIEYN